VVPCIGARSRLGNWEALTLHLIASWAWRRNWRHLRVVEAKNSVSLRRVTNIQRVTLLTNCSLFFNISGF